MESYWIVAIIVALIIGIIPAKIAESKGRDFFKWYIYGVLLFFFAMIHAIVLPENNEKVPLKTFKSSLVENNKENDLNETRYVDINCPIEIRGYKIQVDESSDNIYCSLKFSNLSDKIVTAVKFIIKCYDSFGQPVGNIGENEVKAIIQDETIKPKDSFGLNKPIALAGHSATRKIDVIITDILFNDGLTWEKGDNELLEQKIKNISDHQELANLKTLVGNDAICYPEETEDTWTCLCGRLNSHSTISCIRCGRNKGFIFENYANNGLVENGLKVKALEEEELRLQQESDQQSKDEEIKLQQELMKKKLIKALPFAVTIIVVLFVGWVTQFTFSYNGYKLTQYHINRFKINSILSNGQTYLTNVIYNESSNHNVDKVRVLLENGADVNLKNKYVEKNTFEGVTPLELACYRQNIDIVNMLIEHGADVNAVSVDGYPPLSYTKDGNIAKTLIEHGTNVNFKDSNDDTPLIYASDNAEVTRVLLDNGANVNDKNNYMGGTALIYACYKGNYDVAKLLVDGGADITIKNHLGNTALDAAIYSNNTNLINLLSQKLAEKRK